MTNEQKARIAQALVETCDALERAERFQIHLRDKGLVEFYRNHIAKLQNWLANNATATVEF